jgi:hypothetical protein
LIVTRSETSDDAVQKFDASIEKLQKLDIAKGYVDLLANVADLSKQVRSNFKSSPQAALQPYLRLKSIVSAVKQAQPAAEDAAPHLVDHLERTVKVVWQQMKDAFSSEFEGTLGKFNWPNKDAQLDSQLQVEWTAGVERLLDLQDPELQDQESRTSLARSNEDPIVLLPLEVMMKPLELRFKYHFETDRPTNRPDRPEYFLSHVIGLLNAYEGFFGINLQPVLLRHFRGSNLALNSCYIDSTSALITAQLPMVRQKIFALLPVISKQPQLLSHLMHELMSFDGTLRDEWGYDGGFGADGWNGLTWEVLVENEWFSKWLKVEKDCEFLLSTGVYNC